MLTKDSRFGLIDDMYESADLIKEFRTSDLSAALTSLRKHKQLYYAAEGSSRLFPAKNAIYQYSLVGGDLSIMSEGGRQAAEVALKDSTLFVASNSGQTKEVIDLLEQSPTTDMFAITANQSDPFDKLSTQVFELNCGKERAVAATKSVIEQGLFLQELLYQYNGASISTAQLQELSEKATSILHIDVDEAIISALSSAHTLYFAGRNNGVAEEAALKANEIVRKKSQFLEGTYIVHGIEEVMDENEAVILVDPFETEEALIQKLIVEAIGVPVIAISSRETMFPTIKIPEMKEFDGYLQLFACWNVLASVGLALGIDIDKPARARKVGNEY